MTPELFDTLIIGIMVVGGALAVVRFYRDVSRPLPEVADPKANTQPHQPIAEDPTDQNETSDQPRGD